jgi:hypothetical protein
MDTNKVDEAANTLLASLRLGEGNVAKSKLVRADIITGRHIEHAFIKVQQEPTDRNEFELAVYLRVWSEIASRLLVM